MDVFPRLTRCSLNAGGSSSLTLQRKLQKLVLEHAKIARLKEVDGFGGETYLLPKRLVKLSAPRALSEAQKAVLTRFSFGSVERSI